MEPVVYQSLSNNALYKHRYLENINIFYKSSGNVMIKNYYKDIIEAKMVLNTEGLTNNGTM